MKTTLFLISIISSSILFAEEPRIETKTRIVDEKIIKLSKCPMPKASAYDGSQTEYIADRNGNMHLVNVPNVTVDASSTLTITKCQTVERYKVSITGSYLKWNRKESEIADSQKRSSAIITQAKEISKSQSFIKGSYMIIGASSNEALTMADGLKFQVKQECENELQQLNESKVDINETDCQK
jgi:hypothetical protein